MIVETCPKCGNYLQTIVLTSYPPIPKKICYHCGWSWIGDRESVEAVTFVPPKPRLENTEENHCKTNKEDLKNKNMALSFILQDFSYIVLQVLL